MLTEAVGLWPVSTLQIADGVIRTLPACAAPPIPGSGGRGRTIRVEAPTQPPYAQLPAPSAALVTSARNPSLIHPREITVQEGFQMQPSLAPSSHTVFLRAPGRHRCERAGSQRPSCPPPSAQENRQLPPLAGGLGVRQLGVGAQGDTGCFGGEELYERG